MAMTQSAVNSATEAWVQRNHAAGSAGRFVLWVASTVWLAIAAFWTVRFWMMLADASTVLAMFEAENGGPLTLDEWGVHSEAREIFCPHPNGDPSTNRIGRYISADFAYIPILAMGGLLAYGSAFALLLLNNATDTRHNRWFMAAIVLMVALTVVPIVLFGSEINALTQITE